MTVKLSGRKTGVEAFNYPNEPGLDPEGLRRT